MEIPDPADLSVFRSIFDRHEVERLLGFFLSCNRTPFPVRRALTKDASLRLHVEVVIQVLSLLNAILVTDPNVSVNSAISTDGNIQMGADDMPHAPRSGPAQSTGDLGINVIPEPATTASQIVMERAKHISEVFIA